MARKGVILVDELPQTGSYPVGRSATTLQPVANRPILWHVLDALREADVTEMVAIVPVGLAEAVRSCLAEGQPPDVEVQYVLHDDAADLSNALITAAALVGDAPSILHLADGLLLQPISRLFDRLDQSCADLMPLMHPGARREERLSGGGARILRIAEVCPTKTALGVAGACLFGPGVLRRAGQANWLSGARLDLTAVADDVEAGGGSLDVQMVAGWRRYAGRTVDLLELNRIVLERLSPDLEAAEEGEEGEEGDNQFEGRVAINPTAHVTSSTIVGPVIIGAGARVSDSYLGPYTSVGAQARIEGAEIERSIIAAGVSITHVGGRLVSSVVGANARIFRGFSLPRAIRLHVGADVEVMFW